MEPGTEVLVKELLLSFLLIFVVILLNICVAVYFIVQFLSHHQGSNLRVEDCGYSSVQVVLSQFI